MRRGNILAHIATLSGGVALMLHANDPVVVGSYTIPPLALVIVGSAMALMAGVVLADRLARGGYTLYLFLRSQSPIKVSATPAPLAGGGLGCIIRITSGVRV